MIYYKHERGVIMEIRLANKNDISKVSLILKSYDISYITIEHFREDVKFNRQFIMTENENIIAILSLVYDNQYNYYAMKRLLVTNEYKGKGYARIMLNYVSQKAQGKVGCTPWTNNAAMRHLLETLNFHLEYIFDNKWCYYVKQV